MSYNGHRIHYDRDYARDVEGYPGLVVHGPLQAILMAEHIRRRVPTAAPGTTLRYRLLAPAFDDDGLVISSTADGGRGIEANVHTRAGLHTATATLTTADTLPSADGVP